MTGDGEKYVHFVSCIDDLNEAWRILHEIRRAPSEPLVGAAFQFALVAYARPYKPSRGESQEHHKLDASFVPAEHLEQHRRILVARDQILAHSDLTIREARLHVESTSSGKFVGAVENVVRGTEELAHLDTIIDLVERTLDGMYMEARRLEELLPVNSQDGL